MQLQKREIIMAVILSIVTCGIYQLYWYYKLAEEVNIVTNNEQDMSPILVVVLTYVTCGIYGFIWAYQTGMKMETRKKELGMTPGGGSAMYLLLFLVGAGLGVFALVQMDINNIIDRISGGTAPTSQF